MIRGNIIADFQIKTTLTNEIGEKVPTWETVHKRLGFLDLNNGDSKKTIYNAKVQESSHIFICDYFPLDPHISPNNARLMIGGKIYSIQLIDNPIGLNRHLEIYLSYTGV